MTEVVAERRPLPHVAQALVEAALGQAGRERGDRDPALVENPQELGVTPARLPEHVADGHPAVTE